MLVNLPISVQFVPGSALKLAHGLPWNPRSTPQVPPNQNHILRRLPNPNHIYPNLAKQDSTVKPQCPEDQFVLVNSTKRVQWVYKRYIIPAKLIKTLEFL